MHHMQAMEKLTLHHGRSERIWHLIVMTICAVVASFSLSKVFGAVVSVAVVCIYLVNFSRIRAYVERPTAALVITDSGLTVAKSWTEDVAEIPWKAMEAMKVSRGKNGTWLLIRMTRPEADLTWHARAYGAVSWHDIRIPISGLELPAKEVASTIESVWRNSK